jgi:hypothetical protein
MTGLSDVWGLEYALVSKADKKHVHTFADIDGLLDLLQTLQPGEGGNQANYISDIQGLAQALDEKAPIMHSHQFSQIEGLTDLLSAIQIALDERADIDHSHAPATTSSAGFMTAADKAKLDGLGGSSNPTISDVQGLTDALNSKSDFTHSHAGLPSANLNSLSYAFSQSSVLANANGSYANLTDGNNTSGAGTDSTGSISWLRADLGSNKLVSHIKLQGGTIPGFGDSSTYLKGAAVEGSLDGSNWVILLPVATGVLNVSPVIFALPPTVARYVRLSRPGYLGATEIMIYGS